jgi:site-specific recombinase XerD
MRWYSLKIGDEAMATTNQDQGTILKVSQDTYILSWINGFLLDRKAQNISKGTLTFYQKKLKLFTDYCNAQVITQITELTPEIIRLYLLYLEE